MKKPENDPAPDRRVKQGPIGLGDLVRAAGEIGATAEQCARIAGMLKIRLPVREIAAPLQEPVALKVAPPEPPLPLPIEALPRSIQAARPDEPIGDGEEFFFHLLPVSPASDAPPFPAWLDTFEALRATVPATAPRVELQPLFELAWTRNIVAMILSTSSGEGPIDGHRLIDNVSRCKPIQSLPRLPWPTLRRGVQLLVDRSETMAPFRHDVTDLVARVKHVVGESHMAVLHFDGDPRRTRPDAAARRLRPSQRWAPYKPPAPGIPVLVVSDLGIRRPDGVALWRDFASTIRHASCPFLALCPYSRSRLPEEILAVVTTLHWNRTTTVGEARRTLQRQQRRHG